MIFGASTPISMKTSDPFEIVVGRCGLSHTCMGDKGQARAYPHPPPVIPYWW
jgi:hypothetical protein